MAAGAALSGDEEEDSGSVATAPPQANGQGAPAVVPSGTVPPNFPSSPMGAQVGGNPIENAQGQRGTIPTNPVKPEYDPKKLAKVNTTLDLLQAMTPKSRTDYMDWYEQQHGSINDHYDKLQQDLGQRPTDQGYNKTEKFAALLEFGLSLLKNSAQPSTNQGGVLAGTLQSSIQGAQKAHQAGIEGAQGDYDTQAKAIEASRQKELAGIGTPAQAWSTQSTLNKNDAETMRATVGAAKDASDLAKEPEPKANNAVYIDKNGNRWQQNAVDGTWSKSTDAKGNTLPPTDRGTRGGMGHESVYAQALREYDARNPVPAGATADQKAAHDQAALAYAKGNLPIDSKTYSSARSQAVRELGSRVNYVPEENEGLDYDSAIRERAAEVYDEVRRRAPGGRSLGGAPPAANPIESPPGAASRGGAQPFGAPPASLLQGLKPGMAREINGQKWALDLAGNPYRVDNGLTAH